MKFIAVLIASFFFFINCNNPQTRANAINQVQKSMDQNADTLLLDEKITSVSIGIYKDGRKYTSHYGELDKNQGNPPTDQTIYGIASVSKTMTGILVANAVLDGKLNLEDDIRLYLKEDFDNFEYDGEPIRIKHLLSHTSGMAKFLPESINDLFSDFNESLPFKVHEIQKNYSKKDFFADLHLIKIDTTPGINYLYSNIDTEIMAQILENVYEQSFNEILTEYYSTYANMPHTQIDLPKDKEQYLANGYGMTGKLVPHEIALYGADGGVKTTMPDLVNYMEFQLDTTNAVVSESHRILYENEDRKIAYYLPVRYDEDYGTYYNMHGGGFGSQNWFFILPKYNLGISVITNQSDLETPVKLMRTVEGIIHDLK